MNSNPSLPRLHLVGGFLGSGKTTAIAAAAKLLAGRGERVGILTNDQGRYLVDTAFARSLELPALEVSGGCFCCRLDDFRGRLDALIEKARPQVIFAESVGSCADLVATVIKPLLVAAHSAALVSSLSVFADARLLLRYLRGEELPFSEPVCYLFGKQLEEAGLLVANKRDLLMPGDMEELPFLLARAFPGKPVRLQNSLEGQEVQSWLAAVEAGQAAPPVASLDLDYARYAQGETRLAWLDARLAVDGQERAADLLAAIFTSLRQRGIPLGHAKTLLKAGNGRAVKVSLTQGDTSPEEGDLRAQLAGLGDARLDVLLNLRAETAPENLRAVLDEALTKAPADLLAADAFLPGVPRPTERVV